jgi:predicted ATPase/DNA-binding CsgD family transcriptional regulator
MRHRAPGTRHRGHGNLPAELTTFVGRERELDEIAASLTTSRLITLVGPGGVGKTRLAMHAASRLQRAFPDGTWIVELGALRDPTLLAEHVAAALGLRDESGRWLVATLTDHMSRRHVLLLLDNCEHLLDACAGLARALLQACSEMRILATSREPLAITAESLVHVPPLDVDGPAVQLLVDRATAVRPEFRLTDASRPAALELCRRLDGIPLAIELAAARLRGMALGDIVERMDDRFALLSTGDRSAPMRQRTMRAALDWSHELLSPDERVLWRRLAVFAGSFDAAAAAAICFGDDALPAQRIGDVVSGLAERSIVHLDDALVGRYRLLETVREYAAHHAAEAGELEWLRTRHRDYYLELARRASRSWASSEQVPWFRRLSSDYDNLRQALERCQETPDTAAVGLDVAARLWLWWQAGGRLGEGRRWVSTFLAAAPPEALSRPFGQWAAGYLALVQRDAGVAETALTEALALAQKAGDTETETYAIGHLGLVQLFEGSYGAARALLTESAHRHRREGRPGIAAFQLADAAIAATLDGDTDTAIPEFEESLAASRRLGDTWTESHALWGLGLARLSGRDPDEAEAAMEPALRLMRDVGDRTGMALCLEGLALAAAAAGDAERAAWLVGAAEGGWNAIPAPPPALVVELRQSAVDSARAALGQRRFATLATAGKDIDPADAVARALGETARQPSEPASQPLLTRREREVASLVARGLSNRDIAQRLVLSTRTIESHVERIMNRLGMGSRTEIAAWAVRHLDLPEGAEIP